MGVKQHTTCNIASVVTKLLTILLSLSFTHTSHHKAKCSPLSLEEWGQKDGPLDYPSICPMGHLGQVLTRHVPWNCNVLIIPMAVCL